MNLPMVCVCSEEGKLAADATKAWVLEHWRDGTPNMLPLDDESRWLDYLCYSLSMDFDANIEMILSDMWHGIAVDHGPAPQERISIQCDRVEDGLFAIYKHLWERYAYS